jgi:tetratricopeptide (TPR) repeat protein
MTPVMIPDFPLSDQDLLEAGMFAAKEAKFDLAERLFLGSVSLNGRNYHSLGNLGSLLSRSGRLDEAQEYLTRAIATRPSHAVAWAMLATVYNHKNQFLDARLCDQRAIELDPSHAEFHKHLAGQWEIAGNWDKAEECYKKAVELAPADAYIRTGWGMVKMLRGDFAYGLPLYECRRQLSEAYNVGIKGVTQHPIEIFARWATHNEECEQIVIECEQGVGDLFQMSRYAPMLQKLFPNANIVLHCFPALVDLMKRFYGFHDIVSQDEEIEHASNSFSVAVMSLPYLATLFGQDIYQPPTQVNLEGLPPVLRNVPGRDFKIGVCWKGNPGHGLDRFRSVPFEAFRQALPYVQSYTIVNLQYKDTEAPDNWVSGTFTWEQTLATVSKIDLVLTVDTAVAHLAGTIGKPVWLLTAALNDFRWQLEKETTPWYNSMILIRQEKLLSWEPVMARVRQMLQKSVQ